VAYPDQQAHCKSQLSKMVELRLDSVDDASMPSDCYVSVRVGDIQKLSRLSSTRVYRFPQASDKRYGKIEVFRRIGACSVDVDPLNENLRNVSISCQEAGFGSLGLKIAVEADEGTKKKSETTDPVIAGKKPPTKVKEAKEYLSKHSLEVRLSEAMQAVLRERPEDPTAFLASKLLEHTKSEKRPPLEISSPQPQKLEHVGTAAKPAPPLRRTLHTTHWSFRSLPSTRTILNKSRVRRSKASMISSRSQKSHKASRALRKALQRHYVTSLLSGLGLKLCPNMWMV